MLMIRLSKADWAKAWRVMIEVAPVRLVAGDPVYEVLPAHLDALTARGFSYEIVPSRPLKEIMGEIGARAEAGGLTPETLESLLSDE